MLVMEIIHFDLTMSFELIYFPDVHLVVVFRKFEIFSIPILDKLYVLLLHLKKKVTVFLFIRLICWLFYRHLQILSILKKAILL